MIVLSLAAFNKSVQIFTFAIPSSTALDKFSSPEPDPPLQYLLEQLMENTKEFHI